MKKILIIHNKYKNFGGEDSNILDEINFLKHNFVVGYLEYDNSERLNLSDLFGFLFGSSYKANKRLILKINDFKPDVVYIHNTWFKANLGIFKVLKSMDIKIILKIHNFRFYCTRTLLNKTHFEGKNYCPKCGNKNRKFSLINKYFQDSYFKSLFVTLYGRKYYKILVNSPIKIFVLNEFYKNFMIQNGIDKNKITVSYNPIQLKEKVNYNVNSDYVVYAGTIIEQKGVNEMIDSFLKANLNLKLLIIGEGNQLFDLKEKYADNSIEFLGFKNHEDVLNYIENARCVITATKMFEGQPRILIEASKYGVPSIFPSYGGMNEYFPKNYKLSFEQFNYEDLVKKIKLINNKDFLNLESQKIQDNIKTLLDEKLILKDFENY